MRRPIEEIVAELRGRISTLGITEKVDVRVADLAALLREASK